MPPSSLAPPSSSSRSSSLSSTGPSFTDPLPDLDPDALVFLAGVLPFAWAAVEFWRRIAAGASFGTGKDSVIIGKDDSPADSRGRKVLGKGALAVAYALFAIAGGAVVVSLLAVAGGGGGGGE
ncbi:hypothetical protein TeGR_g11568 [Tetraparma gracilis]|uniref:Uncharacterized protein n=1 Tax=Tetraparma gracilis TaxID=2962635 RepID=A0ABQ6MKV0_9STRA|nr:hypothetical protein TeGR_g11568 [Tetraparma gracilis]